MRQAGMVWAHFGRSDQGKPVRRKKGKREGREQPITRDRMHVTGVSQTLPTRPTYAGNDRDSTQCVLNVAAESADEGRGGL
jgi:hypothetical protein